MKFLDTKNEKVSQNCYKILLNVNQICQYFSLNKMTNTIGSLSKLDITSWQTCKWSLPAFSRIRGPKSKLLKLNLYSALEEEPLNLISNLGPRQIWRKKLFF